MKQLLVVVDMQNDFVTGSLGSADAVKIVPNVVDLVQKFNSYGDFVVFTRDTHGDNYLATQEGTNLPVVHCVKDTWGWQIVDELAPYVNTVIDKPTFASVELGEFVKQGQFDKVTLVGLCTDICVISNAMIIKGFCPETQVAVVSNCCAGVTAESHNNALNAMKMCQVRVEE